MYRLKSGLKIRIFKYCHDYWYKIIVIIGLKFIPAFLHYSFNLAFWLKFIFNCRSSGRSLLF